MSARGVILAFVTAFLALGWVASCILYRAAEMGANLAPIPDREFAALTLVAVGTGGPYENPERRGPAMVIAQADTVLLVDAGRGVAEGLRAAQIPLSQISAVLLTNLQAENTVGLDDLLFAGWLVPRREPLRLFGPPGTRELALGIRAAHRSAALAWREALDLPAAGIELDVIEVEAGWSRSLGEIRATAGQISGGPLPALAWRFEHAGRSAVVSGTGWGEPDLETFAASADLLVHEAVYIPTPEDAEAAGVTEDPERLRREATLHTSILEVGAMAARAGVGTLVLVRMRPPPMFSFQVTSVVGDQFSGSIRIPDDGDEISVSGRGRAR